MFGITLTIALVFVAGFVVGSLFPQPEFIKTNWTKLSTFIKDRRW